MNTEHFDLNDIHNEPTDAQLESLMIAVAEEAKRRGKLAREALMTRLRTEIAATSRLRGAIDNK